MKNSDNNLWQKKGNSKHRQQSSSASHVKTACGSYITLIKLTNFTPSAAEVDISGPLGFTMDDNAGLVILRDDG